MHNKHNFTKIVIAYSIAILLFIVSATAISLYSLGYQFNFKTYELEKTGLLRIEPILNTYSIALDNKEIDENLIHKSTQIPNLKPGKYDLSISLDKFYDWKKNIEILPNQITNIYNVLLLPKKNKIEEVAFANNISVNEKYSMVAFTSKENLQILNYLSEKTQTANNIKINNSSQIDWINDDLLAITNSNPEETIIQILNPFNNNTLEHKIPHSINASDILGTIPLNENTLMYFHNNTIFTTDTLNDLEPQTLIENIYNPVIVNNVLYYLPSEKSTTLLSQNLTIKTTNELVLPIETQTFFPIKRSNNLFVIQNTEKSMIFNLSNPEDSFTISNIKYAEESFDQKDLLLSSENEILIAEKEDNKYIINTILRLSTNLSNTIFVDENNIFYGSQNQLSRIDTDGDNHNIIEENENIEYQILFANKEKILTSTKIDEQYLIKYVVFDIK